MKCDALIVGGGPSGCAAALQLKAAGLEVAVLEASRYERFRPGETLLPRVGLLLCELGCGDLLGTVDCLECFGTQSAWGQASLDERSYFGSVVGHGFHVARAQIDRALALCCERRGIPVHMGARLTRIHVRPDGQFEARDSLGGTHLAAAAVDATGRHAVLSRQLGGRIQRVDRLVACISQYAVVGAKQLTLVEATPQGYLYSAPVPSERLVVAQLTDADLAPGATLARELVARIAAAPHTRARIGNATPLGTPQLYPACSQRMLPGAKRGRWLAVGDAAFAVDPLSGSGYLRAIQRGCSGAEALSRALAGDAAALDRHEQAVHADFDRYLAQRSEVYQQETRFPDAAFWARRRPELARAG